MHLEQKKLANGQHENVFKISVNPNKKCQQFLDKMAERVTLGEAFLQLNLDKSVRIIDIACGTGIHNRRCQFCPLHPQDKCSFLNTFNLNCIACTSVNVVYGLPQVQWP